MPEVLQNQIAAGEVVERPASVVKELVENALDAGATKILVEIQDGGRTLVRVLDNGSGMSRGDARLALERHATSKLLVLDDLRNIHTFGFRGEALPSIASVSRFTLRTRRSVDREGTEVSCLGGSNLQVTDVSFAAGTEVVVEDLFFNVPARRKFLKKDATEVSRIVEVIQRMALATPEVSFKLTNDGRSSLSVVPERDLLARIYRLGPSASQHLFECYLEGPVTVRGFISEPAYRKRDASNLYTFVNGRFVRDKLIIQAIRKGYGTLLGGGEYPYVVLNIVVSPAEVDVNVHPTKSEVRFLQEREVFGTISRAIQLTLQDNPHVHRSLHGLDSTTLQPEAGPGPGTPWGRTEGSRGHAGRVAQELPFSSGSSEFPTGSDPAPSSLWEELEGSSLGPKSPSATKRAPWDPARVRDATVVAGDKAAGPGTLPESVAGMRSVRYIGQFANTYLLGQAGSTLVVVDQHAAHERILFEQLRAQFGSGSIVTQPLLVPILLELDPALVAAVESRNELLDRLGFRVDVFGETTVAVKGVPAFLGQRSPAGPLAVLLQTMEEAEEMDQVTLFHKPISTLACHAAVRAGDPLTAEEATALFREMDLAALSAFCPHGRPSVVFLDEETVGRWFRRT
jgi:DNA mismatch repair protein MutL